MRRVKDIPVAEFAFTNEDMNLSRNDGALEERKACIADICGYCGHGRQPLKKGGRWWHDEGYGVELCPASPIYNRIGRE